MRGLIALAVAVCIASPALAQVEAVSERPDSVAVAVYRDSPVNTAELLAPGDEIWRRQMGLALIVETRTIDLPAGEGVIRFRGLATGMIPQTATLDGLPADVVERNTDFDLLTPASLLQRSVGERVQVVRTNGQTGREEVLPAIVRSGAAGAVLEIEGRLEALDCQGLTQRIVFDNVPEGLGEQPVLSVRTRAATAGRHTVTLAYLATGLQWSADYVARLNPEGTLDLTGWITLANFGGTTFPAAPVQVVAGRLDRDYDTRPLDPALAAARRDCWPVDTTTTGPMIVAANYGAIDQSGVANKRIIEADFSSVGLSVQIEYLATVPAMAQQSELGDYKVYTLPEPTDVNARQTKQVRFLEQSGVRFTRVYRYEVEADETYGSDEDGQQDRPEALLKLRNVEADGLGVPLPGGGVSLVETREGRALFAGQTSFDDRAIGLPVELTVGDAADIAVAARVVQSREWTEGAESWRRISLSVTVSNEQTEPVEVEILPRQQAWAGYRLLRSSQRSVVLDNGATAWRVRVPAGGSRVLTYTIQYPN